MKRKPGVGVLVLVGTVACGGSSDGGSETAKAPSEPAPGASDGGGGDAGSAHDGGGDAGSAHDGGGDAGAKGDGAAPAPAGVGNCAGCTASKCGPELQGCAGAQACVNALVAFNDCFGKQTDGTSGTCGATFSKNGGAKAAALWACDQAKCASECGVP
jgi:hypothetical protein